MMNKHFSRGAPPLLTALLLLGFLFSRCDKSPDPPLTEEEKLPPATQEGKGTFGCLVDGKAWVPKSGGLLNPGLSASYGWGNLGIDAIYYENNDFVSALIFGGFVEDTGIYYLDSTALYVINSDDCLSPGLSDKYFHCIDGKMEITRLDLTNRIVSGKFEYDAVADTCPQDTVRIKNGRFDVKL